MQPEGKGKYVFDIGCQQHGEYVPIEQVKIECSYIYLYILIAKNVEREMHAMEFKQNLTSPKV